MLARQLAYIKYVRGSMSTLQILLFLYFYGFMPPTLSMEEPQNEGDFLFHQFTYRLIRRVDACIINPDVNRTKRGYSSIPKILKIITFGYIADHADSFCRGALDENSRSVCFSRLAI